TAAIWVASAAGAASHLLATDPLSSAVLRRLLRDEPPVFHAQTASGQVHLAEIAVIILIATTVSPDDSRISRARTRSVATIGRRLPERRHRHFKTLFSALHKCRQRRYCDASPAAKHDLENAASGRDDGAHGGENRGATEGNPLKELQSAAETQRRDEVDRGAGGKLRRNEPSGRVARPRAASTNRAAADNAK